MYLTKVAPLSRIPRPSPQFLAYFTKEKLKRGSLVLVPLRKKKVKAIVFSQTNAIEKKIDIKKASYEIKPIIKILKKNPVINENQIKLAKWIADYYWASFGKVLSIFLRNSKEAKEQKTIKNSFEKKIVIGNFEYFPKKEIEVALSQKKEVLFLVPEKKKEKFWKEKLKKYNSPNLIIGTRASLFKPFESLGLIVLTQEGNKSYKSQMEPKYNAKKTAEELAKIWQAKIIITSSFPSVETYYEAKKIALLKNKAEKIIVDMRKIKPWQPISPPLLKNIKETGKRNKKTILFLQRRGEATTFFCKDCGWIQKCQDCEVPMTYHKKEKNPSLVCHYCAKEIQTPRLCKECKSWNLDLLGSGIEKTEKFLQKNFKKEKILRMDSDKTKTEKEQKSILEKFLKKDAGILLTTSIIFKYFPIKKTALLGIISIDSLLSQPDFKTEEECARITQELLLCCKEKFILQTFFPDAKAVSWIKKGKELFYKKTLKERKRFFYPPFSSLIKLSFGHKRKNTAKEEAYILKEKIEQKIKDKKEIEIIGPAPAFIEKIRGSYQQNIIIKLKTKDKKVKMNILAQVPPSWRVDVDPERII